VQVILLKDVEKVGLRGEVVSVARGYARNFLLPRRLAEEATSARVAELEKRDAQRARHEAHTAEEAKQIADRLAKAELRFDVKAGPTGVLFGSVTRTDIADEIWRTLKIRVDRRKLEIDTIKRIGRHEVPIELFPEVTVAVKTLVVPEGGELPSDEELAAMEEADRAEREAAAPAAEATPDLEYLDEPEADGPVQTAAEAAEAADSDSPPAARDADVAQPDEQ
jgi:large subunit ribosomal protein L9